MNKLIAGFGVAVLLSLPVAAFASTVTATAGTGATISPSGTVNVPLGITQTFSVGASKGYSVSNVSVDGVSQGAIGAVDILGDIFNHTVDVSADAVFVGGGELPFCSGPMAPGWNSGLADGGCGGAVMTIVHPGEAGCPVWFMSDCVLKQ